MRNKQILVTTVLGLAMLALPGMSLAAAPQCAHSMSAVKTQKLDVTQEADQLLRDVQWSATKIADHADKLEIAADEPTIDWQFHADHINQIRNELNKMGKTIAKLQRMQDSVLPWQKAAIQQAEPLVQLMAVHTRDAIKYLNAEHDRLWTPTYRKFESTLYNEAQQLSESMGRYVDYAKVHSRDQHLQDSLGIKSMS